MSSCDELELPTDENILFWRSSYFRDMEFVSASIKKYNFSPHSHDTYLFGLIECGFQSAVVRGQLHHAGPGSIYLLNPGDVHDGSPDSPFGYRYRSIYPCFGVLKDMQQDCRASLNSGTLYFRDSIVERRELALMFKAAHTMMERRPESLCAEELMYTTIQAVLCDHAGLSTSGAYNMCSYGLQRARDLIAATPEQDLGLQRLAAIAGMSRGHFIRAFKNTFFITPHAFQTDMRVQKAKRLLRKDESLAEIALLCGFADQAHFTRSFKSRTGITPAVYRAAKPHRI